MRQTDEGRDVWSENASGMRSGGREVWDGTKECSRVGNGREWSGMSGSESGAVPEGTDNVSG